MADDRVTFCRICEAHCGLVATVEDGRVTRLRPDREHPLSRGYACPKGIAMTEVQNDPDRVVHPLRRRAGGGGFERVSWEEALDDIGRRLRAVLERHGPASVGWYMGNPGAFSYAHTLWVKGFLDALGSPHYYSAGSQDVNNRFAASALLYGTPLLVPIPDLARTSFLLILGANPLVSHGSVLTAPRVRDQLHDVVRRGGRVVVVDPRRTETARQFEHVAVHPDADAWLLLSLLHVLFEEGLADERALGALTAGARELRAAAARHPPEDDRPAHGRRGGRAARAGPRPRRGAERRGLRAHRLVPGALRHADGLPARRGQRRHRQPRRPRRRRLRPPGDRARRGRRAHGPGHLRADALAYRRLPGRDRQPARLAAAARDHHARRAADPRAVRQRGQPGAVGARRRRAGGGARRARPVRVAGPLRQRDQPPRRLRAAGDDLAGARRPADRLPRLLHDAVRAVDRRGRRRRAARRARSGRSSRDLAHAAGVEPYSVPALRRLARLGLRAHPAAPGRRCCCAPARPATASACGRGG